MAARPEATGKRRSPLPWKTPVGADSISARFAAARGSAGGACPSPANRGERPTKRDGPDHPGNRRAGCPHPAGPCGGANIRGRIWNPPLQTAARPEATGKRRPPLPWQTPVGADSISARFAAARGSAGGPWPSPTNHGKRPTKRDGPDHPGNRRAGCPHPAGPCGDANVRGLIWNPPLRINFMFRANRMAVASVPARRGGPWPSRGGSRRGKAPSFKLPMCGGRERPPYRMRGTG